MQLIPCHFYDSRWSGGARRGTGSPGYFICTIQRWGLKYCVFPWNGKLGVPGPLHLPSLLQGQKSGSGEGEGNIFVSLPLGSPLDNVLLGLWMLPGGGHGTSWLPCVILPSQSYRGWGSTSELNCTGCLFLIFVLINNCLPLQV